MNILLIAGGVFHLCFGFFHIRFWKFSFLNWREELLRMSCINRAVIQMLNVAVVVFMFLISYISFRYSQELPTISLGRDLLFGVSIFWFVRLVGEFTLKDRIPVKQGIIVACNIGILLYLVPAITNR
jgi:hypothetical protein